MAIRDIISFGFGNGTFDPGVNKLPTLGYAIGAAVTKIAPLGLHGIEHGISGKEKGLHLIEEGSE